MKCFHHNFRAVFLLIWLCLCDLFAYPQNENASLEIGDVAPPLRIKEWIKGPPIQQFETGKVYILEFWATWCKPCVAAMPRLTALTRKYRDQVTSIAVDVYESKTTTIGKVKAFVDSMDQQIDFHVGLQDSNAMVKGWIEAAAEQKKGIPITFVVNDEGRLAWIGHPKDLEHVLKEIVERTWDLEKAAAEHKLNRDLAFLDAEVYFDVIAYRADPLKDGDLGKPDSVLVVINKLIEREPRLRYAPNVVYYTFSSLLIIDPARAYQYGNRAIKTSGYPEPVYDNIIGAINLYSDKLKLPPNIYLLAADAYQQQIDQSPYPELENTSRIYTKIAECYWRANLKSKAIEAQQKAIDSLKSKKDVSRTDLLAFEAQLKRYQGM